MLTSDSHSFPIRGVYEKDLWFSKENDEADLGALDTKLLPNVEQPLLLWYSFPCITGVGEIT